MVTLTTSVTVPEDRRITLTLPPETPVGDADVSLTVSPHVSEDGPSDDPKFNREWKAFHEMLPELLTSYRGQHVAIHEGKVVGSGSDPIAISRAAHEQFGNVAILVREVTETPRVVHLRSPFLVKPPRGESS